MDDEFKDLQTLLRLKKYEQPPEGFESYNERFLREFHRRQRWEASQETGFLAVRAAVGRFFESFTVPRYAYVTALAVFGAVALGINGLPTTEKSAPLALVMTPEPVSESPHALALNSPLDLSDLEIQSQLNGGSQAASAGARPRYILDARPASYDASFSF